MATKSKLVKELRQFADKVTIPIDKMYLFGSRVTGKVHEFSDVDLVLVSSKFRRKKRIKRAPPLHLQWSLDYPVDFICLTPEEFKRQKKMIGIIKEAVEKGIKII